MHSVCGASTMEPREGNPVVVLAGVGIIEVS